MGNGEALRHICERMNDYPIIKKLEFRNQCIDDEGMKIIIKALEENVSIQELIIGGRFTIFFFWSKI